MLELLYRDPWLVAVHKPSGLLVHRSALDAGETRFAVQILREQLGQAVHPLHRLDKGTSGVLLFALDRDTARLGSLLFENRQVDKTYLAVVRGHPPESGLIDHALSRRRDDVEWVGERSSFDAQPAQTRYRRLATVELPYPVDRYPTARYALMQLEPLTGRRHQLRRHMKHISHPIIGDATFGKGRHNRFFQQHLDSHRLLLACTRLSLPHPHSGAPLRIDAPPAADFAALIERLGWRAACKAGLAS